MSMFQLFFQTSFWHLKQMERIDLKKKIQFIVLTLDIRFVLSVNANHFILFLFTF